MEVKWRVMDIEDQIQEMNIGEMDMHHHCKDMLRIPKDLDSQVNPEEQAFREQNKRIEQDCKLDQRVN